MLRLLVLALLLLNAAYYAWSQSWLTAWRLGPIVDNEPQRLAAQIEPQSLQLLPPQASIGPEPTEHPAPAPPTAEAAPGEPTQCLQASGLDERQAQALRAAAAALPEGSWTLESTPIAGRWMVFMGRFADQEAVEKKRAELRELNVPFDRPGAAWEWGLSLGRFASEERAEVALAQLARQGIRTARVVLERKPSEVYTLRLPAVTPAQVAQWSDQQGDLQKALGGKKLTPCE